MVDAPDTGVGSSAEDQGLSPISAPTAAARTHKALTTVTLLVAVLASPRPGQIPAAPEEWEQLKEQSLYSLGAPQSLRESSYRRWSLRCLPVLRETLLVCRI